MSRVPQGQFGLLADPKPRWRAFGTSIVLQILILALIAAIPAARPQTFVQRTDLVYYDVEKVAPEPLRPEPIHRERVTAPPPRPADLAVEPPPVEVMKPPAPVLPQPEIHPQEQPHLVRVVHPVNFTPTVSQPAAAKPAREIETNVFGGSSAMPTVNKPAREVQTGGFGDPNGLPGDARGGSKGNVAKLGSFDLPQGSGYGNGSGGLHGVRGVVASAGFGNGIATAAPSSNINGVVRTSGFDQVQAAAQPRRERPAVSAPAVTPVEILYKPRPTYTDEARQLKLEGEVILDVVFSASGEVRVNRVVRGLGHGLDEAAERAAEQIRFKPAMSEGAAVDFPALVHIEFELAY
jgi:TonB family protein